MNDVILIDLINYQSYIDDNIKQLQLLNYNVTIITDPSLITNFINIPNITIITTDILSCDEFDTNNKLDDTFRNGFWKLTSKRLFYLYAYMKQFNKTNCFHIENDIMLYQNIVIPDTNKLWLTMDHMNRCIPGIIFIPHYSYLDKLFNQYNYSQTDMHNCAEFYKNNRDICNTFPIIQYNQYYPYNDIYNKHFDEFGMIFDAAAMGQYLGGIDPRNQSGDTRGFINETCVVNYSHYQFIWIYNTHTTIYLPHIFINNKYIPIANLHIHCKQLNVFLSNFPYENQKYITMKYPFNKEDIITGERFQQMTKLYCGTQSYFNFNPVISRDLSKCLDMNLLTTSFDNPDIIFCYSHQLSLFRSKLQYFNKPFTLITHNSDENITDKYLDIIQSEKIIKWYCQNKMIEHPKLHFIPIGIANSMWTHGNLDNLMDVIQFPLNKVNNFYFNFSVSTNKNERENCKNELEKKGFVFMPNLDYHNYLKTLSSYKFAICPPGNGIDCHRIWECYYLGVIPILKRSIFTEQLSYHFPCIILNDWNDFEATLILDAYPLLLQQLSETYHKLKLSYYFI